MGPKISRASLRSFTAAVIAVWASGAVPAHVRAVPSGFNVQGRLTDKDGINLNGQFPVRFAIFQAAAPTPGESPVWQKTYDGTSSPKITVRNGNFQLNLNDPPDTKAPAYPNLADVFANNSGPLYLQIHVLSEPDPLAPRQQLVSVPYALKAQVAETLPETVNLRVSGLTVTGALSAAQGLPPDFDSGPLHATANSDLHVNHNLGVRPRQVVIWISENADGSGWSTVGGPLTVHPNFVYGVSIFKSEPNTLHLRVSQTVAFVWDETGYPWYYYKMEGYVRVLIWK